ncbi:TIGR04219 family outer membrane beta-barrel protein [Vibrio maerlii]|uniref:TIGR04219 family outer membrane beta-barrel protein n=1 Tax=Vibrio maerlii TaxID=2231648 RepID=UPI000E3DEE7E|nr:TIGR04219 family outer membrane beta-barrel protein [Vibrio maerlii]
MTLKILATASVAAFTFAIPAFANTDAPESIASESKNFDVTLGAEMWWTSTKVNEVRRDDSDNPSFYLSVRNDIDYVPNVRVRYSSVDADYMAFDKYDLTLSYQLMDHELLHFDAGLTFSDLGNTLYRDANNDTRTDFDSFIWAWYGYGEIKVPNTELEIIGEMNFGDSSGIKSTDLMAGVQYRVPMGKVDVNFRGGYRVIDLESEDFAISSAEDGIKGKEFIFADGWFLGADVTF